MSSSLDFCIPENGLSELENSESGRYCVTNKCDIDADMDSSDLDGTTTSSFVFNIAACSYIR